MQEPIGKLTQTVPTFTEADLGKSVYQYFESNNYAEGIVVLDGEKPVGLLMRNDFYQKIGTQYGYTLFIKRSINLIMSKNLLIVDVSAGMVDVSVMSMNRPKENLYDFVIVTENGQYRGVVSIKLLLIELSKKREEEIELLKEQRECLNRRNASIKNLMDNAGQGFLSFDNQLLISDEYSMECLKIFETQLGGEYFPLLIAPFLKDTNQSNIESILHSFFTVQEKKKEKVFLSLLPKELMIRGKAVKIEYKSVGTIDNKSVMLILTDITDKKNLEMKMQEQRNELKLILKVLSNKSDFVTAIEDFQCFFENKRLDFSLNDMDKNNEIMEIFRSIHTFKGDFSHLCMFHTSCYLHEMENTLSQLMQNLDSESLESIRALIIETDYKEILKKDLKIISEQLGTDYLNTEDKIYVSEERITKIEETLLKINDSEFSKELLQQIRQLKYKNLKEVLGKYNDSLKALANKLDKHIGDMVVSGDDFFMNEKKYAGVIKSLIHIFRNSIDHGIESPEERLLKGKRMEGHISCKIEALDSLVFTLTIRDDGQGIKPEIILDKALQKEIIDEKMAKELTKGEILGLIFTDEFSTKEELTHTSGRGVGLGAVRAEVSNLGGSITIHSEPDCYTEFVIQLPVLN